MAGKNPVQNLCDETTCSICLEYFKDPVIVDCGHVFCQACIVQCCEKLDEETACCPQCREPVWPKNFRPARHLASIVEIAKKFSLRVAKETEGPGSVCERHQEPLKLFCKDDQAPICVVCDKSKEHKKHNVIPQEEAFEEYKGKIQSQLEFLKKEREAILSSKRRGTTESQNLLFKVAQQHLQCSYQAEAELEETRVEKVFQQDAVDLRQESNSQPRSSALAHSELGMILADLPVEKANDHRAAWKELANQRLSVSEEGARRRFCSALRKSDETFGMLAVRMRRLWESWLDAAGATTKEDVADLMLRESLFWHLPDELGLLVADRCPQTFKEAAKLADEISSRRSRDVAKREHLSRGEKPRERGAPSGLLRGMTEQRSSWPVNWPQSSSSKQGASEKQESLRSLAATSTARTLCFYCKEPGHLKRNCLKLQRRNAPAGGSQLRAIAGRPAETSGGKEGWEAEGTEKRRDEGGVSVQPPAPPNERSSEAWLAAEQQPAERRQAAAPRPVFMSTLFVANPSDLTEECRQFIQNYCSEAISLFGGEHVVRGRVSTGSDASSISRSLLGGHPMREGVCLPVASIGTPVRYFRIADVPVSFLGWEGVCPMLVHEICKVPVIIGADLLCKAAETVDFSRSKIAQLLARLRRRPSDSEEERESQREEGVGPDVAKLQLEENRLQDAEVFESATAPKSVPTLASSVSCAAIPLSTELRTAWRSVEPEVGADVTTSLLNAEKAPLRRYGYMGGLRLPALMSGGHAAFQL